MKLEQILTTRRSAWFAAAIVAAALMVPLGSAQVGPLVCSRTYTLDADFDEGTLINVNKLTPDQLELDTVFVSRPFIWIANSFRGTVVRIDTNTGQVEAEYQSAPQGRGLNPSRTTVDLNGNVWVGNRDEAGILNAVPHGSVVKIGYVVGGVRGDKNADGSFTPNPAGEYLQPPFLSSTAVDRDGDGLIRTSGGLGQVLNWPDLTDGLGDTDGNPALVEDADDECILVFQRLPDAEAVRHVSVGADNNVWVGGHPFAQRSFHQLRSADGAILASFDARPFVAGGYGGLIDGSGVIWSASISQNALLRYDPSSATGMAISIGQSYGTAIDANGFIWNTTFGGNSVVKVSPAGAIVGTFPTGGASNDRGVAVTPTDNHVWVANSGGSDVSRLDNNGNLQKVIPVGLTPTGLSVDSNGKVWVANMSSDNAMRIDPAGGGDGLGAVDLTVSLGAGAGPYNYSDMTGSQLLNTVQQGTWNVVHDSQSAGTEWGTASWTSAVPTGTSMMVEVRADDSLATLATLPFLTVANGVAFCDQVVMGQFLEVQVTLARGTGVADTPVLFDLTVECCNQPPVAVCEDLTVATDPGECFATVTVDQIAGGSYDPDGDVITIEVTPPGPYPVGQTVVTVVVTDPMGLSDTCEATITVVDQEPPVVACLKGTNPSGKNIPKAGMNPKAGQNPPGFYELQATDNCGEVELYVVDSVTGFTAGPYQSGDQVKITQAPGGDPGTKPGPGVIVEHICLKGDPNVIAIDTAGNVAETSCLVPPKPK